MPDGIWDLTADPASIDAASRSWERLATSVGSRSDDFNDASMKVIGRGRARRRRRTTPIAELVGDLDQASQAASDVARVLADCAGRSARRSPSSTRSGPGWPASPALLDRTAA